ncbi:MAG: carbon storage regulator [Flavobacteriales bacterium]|nr:carbon storage regulator [Flavobacteriales bacterium]
MLKITRKPGECLTLIISDGEIHIDFELHSGKQIKLAIDAPDDVGIWRDELLVSSALDQQ